MLGKVNILCAMRDRHMAEELKRELDDGEHCTVQIADDGVQALACSRAFAPDILVIDAVLPEMDGLGVVECLREMLGDRMPRVIGGTMMPLAAEGFRKLGAQVVVQVPWRKAELRQALDGEIDAVRNSIDWEKLQPLYEQACGLLRGMGMRETLTGFIYLAWAAALTCANEARLFAIGKQLYVPIAQRFDTTPQNVERLVRHAVESTVDADAHDVYHVFGNTIDPARGKPTNAQAVGLLVQKMRIGQKVRNEGH